MYNTDADSSLDLMLTIMEFLSAKGMGPCNSCFAFFKCSKLTPWLDQSIVKEILFGKLFYLHIQQSQRNISIPLESWVWHPDEGSYNIHSCSSILVSTNSLAFLAAKCATVFSN